MSRIDGLKEVKISYQVNDVTLGHRLVAVVHLEGHEFRGQVVDKQQSVPLASESFSRSAGS